MDVEVEVEGEREVCVGIKQIITSIRLLTTTTYYSVGSKGKSIVRGCPGFPPFMTLWFGWRRRRSQFPTV